MSRCEDRGFLNIRNRKLEKCDGDDCPLTFKRFSHSSEYLLLCSAEEVWCEGNDDNFHFRLNYSFQRRTTSCLIFLADIKYHIIVNFAQTIPDLLSLALNGGGRIFLAPHPLPFFPPCLLSCLVSYRNTWETLSALLLKTSKLKNHGFDQLVSQRNWHHLLDEKHGLGGA